jgi:ubiquinone biosynthesis protein
MTRHKLKIPPQFHTLIKAIATIDGIARQLDPEFNTIAHTRPFVERLVRERHDPKRIFKDMTLYSSELLDILKIIPRDAYEIVKKIKGGKLKIEFEQGHEIIAEMDKSSNEFHLALSSPALIIGSPDYYGQQGPHGNGFPKRHSGICLCGHP